nr:MAG TPA: hypothetical protein [Caudoviricetes sp.]
MPHEDYLMYGFWSQSWTLVRGTLEPHPVYSYVVSNGTITSFSILHRPKSSFHQVIVELNSLFKIIKHYKD